LRSGLTSLRQGYGGAPKHLRRRKTRRHLRRSAWRDLSLHKDPRGDAARHPGPSGTAHRAAARLRVADADVGAAGDERWFPGD